MSYVGHLLLGSKLNCIIATSLLSFWIIFWIFSGKSSGFLHLGDPEYFVKVCLSSSVLPWSSLPLLCVCLSFSIFPFTKTARFCSLGSFANIQFYYYFCLQSLLRSCYLSHFIFSLEYSRLQIFVMGFHFFFFLSGLTKDCKNLSTASEPTVVRNKKMLCLYFFLTSGISDSK